MLSLETVRAYSAQRSLQTPASLEAALTRLGFVQADPIRAPARAQDLILRPRVAGYTAGDLERRYSDLGIEEDYFVNYGFLTRQAQALMHPRRLERALHIERDAPGLTERVLEFVHANGATHPKTLERHFGKISSGNAWGGTSQATTRALDALHYRGKVRVARREAGIKVYEHAPHLVTLEPSSELEAARGIVHLIVDLYAPLPMQSLGQLASFSGLGAPHLKATVRKLLKQMVKDEFGTATLEGTTLVYPLIETLEGTPSDTVRLLAPFDPIVWDRRRFELLHGWAYRFEAYTPPAKRVRGYYALPLLWRERAIGWANLKVAGGKLEADVGFVDRVPKEKAFKKALELELHAMRTFLGVQ
jgi:uncharacterized protein YcaQ